MSDNTMGRREAARRALMVLGAAAIAPSALAACGGSEAGGLTCTDTSGLDPAQVTARTSNAYSDHAADPSRKCTACTFYRAGAANACGTCQVVQGPIHPDGTCNLFSARPAT